MKKKDIIFIIGLSIFMGVLWIAGELVMGLWIAVVPDVRLIWRIGIVAAALIISLWHAMLEDQPEKKSAKELKYERKTQKKKKD